jgi:TonB family protein
MADLLLSEATHPMPTKDEVEHAEPQMGKQTFGKVPLDCIMLSQPIKGLKSAPTGLFPTYCLDPGKDALRVTFNFGTQLVVRNSIGTFQQRFVSTDMTVYLAGVEAAKGQVIILRAQDVAGADLATDGLQQGSGNGSPVKVSSGTIAGMALKQPQPFYPAMAKARHATGTVVLRAVIGTDGNIYDLSVVSSPDPDLAVAAVAAVRQWQYRPYLFSGEPVEVETTINVNFTFGR